MARKKLPDQDRLRQLLDYDPHTGRLTWRSRDAASFEGVGGPGKTPEEKAKVWATMRAGRPAMEITSHPDGYFRGCVDGRTFLAHRVIWKWWHGDEPHMIDHVNGHRRDNRIANLQPTNSELNALNVAKQSRNTSGHTGVHWCNTNNRWRASITHKGKRHPLGNYDNFDAAVAARKDAERRFGFHRNHGR